MLLYIRQFKLKKIALLILSCSLSLITLNRDAFSLDPDKNIHQYICEIYSTDNGLPQNSVESIIQTREGYIWFATQDGLVRFDGLKFTVFDRSNTKELLSHHIINLHEDKEGSIWIRTIDNVGITRLKDGKFRTYTNSELPSNTILALTHDNQNNIWISTQKGLSRFNGETFETFTSDNGLVSDSITSLFVDNNDVLWMSSRRGLGYYEGGIFKKLNSENGLASDSVGRVYEDNNKGLWIPTARGLNYYKDGKIITYTKINGLSHNTVTDVYQDKRGNLWFGTSDGINKFQNGKFTVYKNQNTDNSVRKIFEDKDNNLWIITDGKGIQRFKNGKFEIFSTQNGLSENNVKSVLEDREGNLWFGTYGGGLTRLRDAKFETITVKDGLSHNMVNTVYEDSDGFLWIGTVNGSLSRYKSGKIKVFKTESGISANTIGPILEDRNKNLWIGTSNGLYEFNNGNFKNHSIKDGIANKNITALTEDNKGNLWIGTRNGLSRLINGRFESFFKKDGLISNTIYVIYEDRQNNIWIGTNKGLSRFTDGKFTNYDASDGLSSNYIFALYEDSDSSLWIGTAGGGLNRLKGDKFTKYNPDNGLFDYNVYVILEDGRENLWMSCNKGIYRVGKKDLNDFADGKISSIKSISYGTTDGMKSRECNGGVQPSAWKTKSGQLCFATVKGVAIIDSRNIEINLIPPPVVIEQFIVNNELKNTSGELNLSPGSEKFEFHYAGITFIGPEKVFYKYKLEGFDNDWINAGTRRVAYYTHIPPGNYKFMVTASNSDGVWNSAGAAFNFTLEPFFYQQSWFIALCLFAFIFIGPGIYALRVRQLKTQQVDLEKIVREKTQMIQNEKEKTETALIKAQQSRNQAEYALKELHETQNQLIFSEKMLSLSQITTGVAHEIKNPLNFITNFAESSVGLIDDLQREINKQKKSLDSESCKSIDSVLFELEQTVKKINEHGNRADSIIKGMLLHSRGKPGEPRLTDINSLISEYANLAYQGFRTQNKNIFVRIDTDYDQTIGKINVVPQNICRAILNIVQNACYAAYEMKKIKHNGFEPVVTVKTKDLDDKVEISIKDNGTGIPETIMDKIFNPFFTTKPPGVGTGLGLSLSYETIVSGHKGDIKVSSKEGEFTEFVIFLPKNGVTFETSINQS